LALSAFLHAPRVYSVHVCSKSALCSQISIMCVCLVKEGKFSDGLGSGNAHQQNIHYCRCPDLSAPVYFDVHLPGFCSVLTKVTLHIYYVCVLKQDLQLQVAPTYLNFENKQADNAASTLTIHINVTGAPAAADCADVQMQRHWTQRCHNTQLYWCMLFFICINLSESLIGAKKRNSILESILDSLICVLHTWDLLESTSKISVFTLMI
jgi:hypothetical protein